MKTNLIQELDQRFSEAKDARAGNDLRWYMSAAFLFGKQWSAFDPVNKSFGEQRAPTWRARVVANMIFPTVRQIVSRIVKQDLSILCLPVNKNEKNKSASRIATLVIKHVLAKNNIKKLAYEVALNIITFGVGYLKTYFDSAEYASIPSGFAPANRAAEIITEEQDLLADAVGLDAVPEEVSDAINLTGDLAPIQPEQLDARVAKIGDIVIESLRPDFVYVDPIAQNIEEARYVFIVKVRSKEYIRDRYDEVVEEQDIVMPSNQTNIDNLVSSGGGKQPKGILVKEYFERPTYDYPNGRHIVIANDKIVKGERGDEENAYAKLSKNCAIPLSQFNYFPTMNNLFTTSLVEQLVPLQKEYNRLRSDVVEHERVLMRGKWLIPIGCGVSQNSLTSEPGEKVYYDPRGGVPMAIPGTPPPPAIWQHILSVKNEFNDIAGLHEVSRGRVPSGVRSASGIMFLQEQDDIQLSITNTLLQEGFLDVARKVVSIAKKYYKEDRILKLSGKGTQIEIAEFKTGVLNDSAFDVFVEFGSKIPYSFVARQQFILSLVDRGLIQDRERIMKLLEFTSEDDLYESTEYDELNARAENQAMAEGQMVMANDYDDHMRHLKAHDAFRKNPEYKQLPQEVQQIFLQHINFHREFVSIMMAGMQEAQEKQEKQGGQERQGGDRGQQRQRGVERQQ